MTTDPDEQEFADRLRRFGASVSTPSGDPRDDLARGRRRRRRRYVAAAAGGVAAVALIGMGVSALGVGGAPSADPATGFAASQTATPTPAPVPPVKATPTPLAEGEEPPPEAWLDGGPPTGLSEVPGGEFPSTDSTPRPFGGSATPEPEPALACGTSAETADLAVYRDIVADHLDPAGEHLQKRVRSVQSGAGPAGCSIGTKLGWTEVGRSGAALVQIEVASNRRSAGLRHEGRGWQVEPVSEPGVTSVRTAEGDGVTAVAVTRSDGTVVSLLADPLFGNDNDVPLEGFSIGTDELIETAADPRFELP